MRRGAGGARWALAAGLGLCALVTAAGCNRGGDSLGLADSYLLFSPMRDEAGQARTSPAGLPLVGTVPVDDPRAGQLQKLFAVGFAGEVLRTDYLVKQYVRDGNWQGRQFSPAARRAAAEPTIFVADKAPPVSGRGLALKGSWGGATDRPELAWVGVADAQVLDPVFVQTVSGALGRRIAGTITAGVAGAEAPILVEGYAQALEVIAREWRVGEGPSGAVAPDAGTAAQRELFAAVRQNRYARGPDGHTVRPAVEMLADPGLAATVLYRMAQAKGVGHRVGPPELYAPFVAQRVPDGVSPAAVLGPLRNFQAKLIAAWGRAALRGQPPRDIVDLVEAYVAELPGERAEVIRLFVVTTWGATVKAGGVSPSGTGGGGPGGPGALPELTALAAEVTAGRRPLRQGLGAGRTTGATGGATGATGGAPPAKK